MKKNIFFLFLVALFALAVAMLPPEPVSPEKSVRREVRYEQGIVSLAHASVSVEMPFSRAGFEKGLGGRTSLPESDGMLFLCLPDAYPQFWMKEMRFPIDIIWINEEFIVVDITPDVSPESFPETFTPSSPVAHVLEVNSGFAKEHSIAPGTMVYGLGGSPCGRKSTRHDTRPT